MLPTTPSRRWVRKHGRGGGSTGAVGLGGGIRQVLPNLNARKTQDARTQHNKEAGRGEGEEGQRKNRKPGKGGRDGQAPNSDPKHRKGKKGRAPEKSHFGRDKKTPGGRRTGGEVPSCGRSSRRSRSRRRSRRALSSLVVNKTKKHKTENSQQQRSSESVHSRRRSRTQPHALPPQEKDTRGREDTTYDPKRAQTCLHSRFLKGRHFRTLETLFGVAIQHQTAPNTPKLNIGGEGAHGTPPSSEGQDGGEEHRETRRSPRSSNRPHPAGEQTSIQSVYNQEPQNCVRILAGPYQCILYICKTDKDQTTAQTTQPQRIQTSERKNKAVTGGTDEDGSGRSPPPLSDIPHDSCSCKLSGVRNPHYI